MGKFFLKKDFISPTITIRAGVVKSSKEWKKVFYNFEEEDCEIKKDWFGEYLEEVITLRKVGYIPYSSDLLDIYVKDETNEIYSIKKIGNL
jgi:hypothetical protein